MLMHICLWIAVFLLYLQLTRLRRRFLTSLRDLQLDIQEATRALRETRKATKETLGILQSLNKKDGEPCESENE